jgi:hypothetical protein
MAASRKRFHARGGRAERGLPGRTQRLTESEYLSFRLPGAIAGLRRNEDGGRGSERRSGDRLQRFALTT